MPLLIAWLALGCGNSTTFSDVNSDVGEVEGTAAVSWSPAALAFEGMSLGITYSDEVFLESTGEGPLRVYAARVIEDGDADVFSVNDEDTTATVNPGQSHGIMILASIDEAVTATGTLEIETNDPEQLTFSIPVSASPPATGGLAVSPSELVFEDLVPGILYSEVVTLESVGEGALEVYSVDVVGDPSNAFDDDYGDATSEVPPGDQLEVLVMVQLEGDAPASASLEIHSNDPDQLVVTVPLSAAPAEAGDTAGP